MKMKLKDFVESAEIVKIDGKVADLSLISERVDERHPSQHTFAVPKNGRFTHVTCDFQQEIEVSKDNECVFLDSTWTAHSLQAFKLTPLNSSGDEQEREREYDPMAPFEAREMGSDKRPFVNGPVTGCNYDSGTLFPEMRLSTYKDAQAATKIANKAFKAGYEMHAFEMRKLLGMKGTWGL